MLASISFSYTLPSGVGNLNLVKLISVFFLLAFCTSSEILFNEIGEVMQALFLGVPYSDRDGWNVRLAPLSVLSVKVFILSCESFSLFALLLAVLEFSSEQSADGIS